MRFIIGLLIALSMGSILAHAETIDSQRLADSIYLAEGGDIAKPYGILKAYCKRGDPDGQCRKGCIQTIEKHLARIEHTNANEFIDKFAEVYAPSKAHKLNKNWPKNVKYFYNRGF